MEIVVHIIPENDEETELLKPLDAILRRAKLRIKIGN